ncbi:uncharacterized protein [Amphiura filiformis]|uniref:uncharacterized protein n=1 Tax=Amphiura filiformis TaxID=82378 RepID=UPI003B217E75
MPGHIHLSKQPSNKSSTIPSMDKINPPGGGGNTAMGGGGSSGVVNAGGAAGSGSVMRPTRLTQPEKLLQLAATTQLGRLADKYSPHGQSSMKEKKNEEKSQQSLQSSQSSSTSTTPIDNPTQLPIIGKPRSRTKRQSSSGSATSDHTITPPDSPDSRKK